MGVYYDMVCERHKATVRLWKAYEVAWRLHDLAEKKERNQDGRLIVLKEEDYALISEMRPHPSVIQWIQEHKSCHVVFGGDDTEGINEHFNFYDGWTKIDSQPKK